MSLESNTAELKEILAMASGGSGGGTSIETCTVEYWSSNIQTSTSGHPSVAYLSYDGSKPELKILSDIANRTTYTLENVVCGSTFITSFYTAGVDTYELENAEYCDFFGTYYGNVFKITAPASGKAVIKNIQD